MSIRLNAKPSHSQREPITREQMGIVDAEAINEDAVLRSQIPNPQGTFDIVDLAVNATDPRIGDTNLSVLIPPDAKRERIQLKDALAGRVEIDEHDRHDVHTQGVIGV
jgi:hypothetical protein